MYGGPKVIRARAIYDPYVIDGQFRSGVRTEWWAGKSVTHSNHM